MSIPTKCQERVRHPLVKIEERRRSATFENAERREFVVTRVDGCVLVGQIASDYVVQRPPCGDVILELKGSDVGHGIKQVEATAAHWKANGYCCASLAGLIVCNQVPKPLTKVQQAKDRFARSHRGPLHIVSRNRSYRFEDLLSFAGP
jgi:hypothetical protein